VTKLLGGSSWQELNDGVANGEKAERKFGVGSKHNHAATEKKYQEKLEATQRIQ
jgi:hypothetical protein